MSALEQAPRFLSLTQLRTRWGISRASIYRWQREGRLPRPIRLGRFPRWPVEEIAAFEAHLLAERTATTEPQRGGGAT
jgi:predicted DNA-binding transcriptional regulator AlpA